MKGLKLFFGILLVITPPTIYCYHMFRGHGLAECLKVLGIILGAIAFLLGGADLIASSLED